MNDGVVYICWDSLLVIILGQHSWILPTNNTYPLLSFSASLLVSTLSFRHFRLKGAFIHISKSSYFVYTGMNTHTLMNATNYKEHEKRIDDIVLILYLKR